MDLLEKISQPSDLKELNLEELPLLAEEVRALILDVVSKNGSHLSSNLGVVELTIALHYLLDLPSDKIIWDVSHQTYTHKILSGRKKEFSSLRQEGGISGFSNKEESPFDIFTLGHASSAISLGLGLITALEEKEEKSRVVVVTGDGSLTGGVSFEGLNQVGFLKKDILIILNANEMSISKSSGALSFYLTRLITNPLLEQARNDIRSLLRITSPGKEIISIVQRLERATKSFLPLGSFFENLGIRYFGPIDGHNFRQLIPSLKDILKIKGPRLLHIITRKGKGYSFSEKRPDIFHSIGPFNIQTGVERKKREYTYRNLFSKEIVSLAKKDKRVVAITAAMKEGCGLTEFASLFPERFFDVGIAEQHALAFAAGLVREGLRPVVSIYSKFLQRALDQIFEELCLQELPVILVLPNSGIVGEDGPTHHGVFDLSYLRIFPNLKVLAPTCGEEMKSLLEKSLEENLPVAIRYPKSALPSFPKKYSPDVVARLALPNKGEVAILGVGSMAIEAEKAASLLREKGKKVEAFGTSFVKPLDLKLLRKIASSFRSLVTVEENVLNGGFGSAVLEYLNQEDINLPLRRIGLPDRFIEQGKRESLLNKYGLSGERIAEYILKK